jgi:hypothetical protein
VPGVPPLRVTIYAKDLPPSVRSSLATGLYTPDSRICLQEHATPAFKLNRTRNMVMNNRTFSQRTSLRLSATLLLVGQLLYIVVTRFHADGDANNHPAVFAEYAGSAIWTAVHLGQFAGMAILLAGLLALFFALDVQAGTARWAGRFGAASAVSTLALYGVLQAVDGVALKQAVNAWASAPDAEKGGALHERRGNPLARVGAEELPELRWASLCSFSRQRSCGRLGSRGR